MLKGLESGFREWDSSLEICFIKRCLCGVSVVEGERKVAVEENTKSFLLLQLAVFLLSTTPFQQLVKLLLYT